VGVNHPFIARPTCKAYPIETLLHAHFAIYAPPPTPLLYAIDHKILAMAISCKKINRSHTHTDTEGQIKGVCRYGF